MSGSSGKKSDSPKLHLWLIAFIGVIVPRRLRADWRQEWEAELRYRETMLAEWDRLDWRAKLDLLKRSIGAFWDALLLQPKRLEDEMFQDLRFGARMLLKNPGFAFVAVFTLALGIGANTAIFSVIYAVMLSPLPYRDAERLVSLRVGARDATTERRLTAPEFVALSQVNQIFDQASTFEPREFILTGKEMPEQLKGQRISSELLPLFGIHPHRGRTFSAEEFQPGYDRVVLISHRLWQSRFGSNEQLIGQSVTLHEQSYTVVGIMPPHFDFFPDTDLFVPLALDSEQLSNKLYVGFEVMARLKPGMSIERAQRESSEVARRLDQFPNIRVHSLREFIARDFRQTLFVLWGVVGFVLAVACANFANLLLARAANRQKEIVIRAALGARRSRIVRQLLTESVLLALLGGAIGLYFAYLGVNALTTAGPLNIPYSAIDVGPRPIPRLGEAEINGWVIAFTFGVSLLTGVIFGLVPALKLSKPDLNSFLKEGATVSAKGFRLWHQQRSQSLLVVAEIALALVLLIGAGLLIKSFSLMKQTTPGFQPERLLTIQFQFPWYRYRDHTQVLSFVERVTEQLEGFPGVQSVSATSSLPLTDRAEIRYFNIEKRPDIAPPQDDMPFGAPPPPPPKPGQKPLPSLWAHNVEVGPHYFQTMGIAIRKGREFDKHDNADSPPVVVINHAMAKRYWQETDPVGQRVQLGGPLSPWVTIVGIVANSRQLAREDNARPMLYRPLLQSERRKTDYKESEAIRRMVDHVSLVVRTNGRAEDLINAAQKQVRNLDPEQPILRIAALEEVLTRVDALPRFNLFLFGVFAGLALTLAIVGIYGVMAYSIAQRTHEIGIRMALGAQTGDVLKLVMKQGLALVITGVAMGLIGAFALTRFMNSFLVGVKATDPLTFSLIAGLLTIVALLACYVPARRATKIDPLAALRHE